MPSITDQVAAEGALIPVQIGLAQTQIQALRKALRPIPPSITVLALLDTGAEMTGIDSLLVSKLGLQPKSSTLANLPAHGGMTLAFKFEIGVTISPLVGKHSLAIPTLSVLDLPLAAIGYQAVLGRDVLATFRFFYDGPVNRFDLSW